jgi:hypothetical protein
MVPMGCAFCGRRQVDPVSGASSWRRAVMAGDQVLVCPDCQREGWTDPLDRCSACGSTMLAKRLGEVSCRGCGQVGDGVPGGSPVVAASSPAQALRAEIDAALDRVLRPE